MAGKKLDCIHIITRGKLARNNFSPIEDHNMRAAGVLLPGKHIQQPGDARHKPGFLQAFPQCRLGRVFAGVDKAGRHRPQPPRRIIHSPHQQHAAVLLNQDSRGYFRVRKEHPPALRAARSQASKAFFQRQVSPALRAVVDLLGDQARSSIQKNSAANPLVKTSPPKINWMIRSGVHQENGASLSASGAVCSNDS